MGIQSDILTQYRALQNAENVPKFTNPNNARVDKMPFVDFVFELLKLTKGRKGFDGIILKGIITDLKTSMDIDEEIKNVINEFLMCNAPMKITKDMTTAGAGIEITIPEIDTFSLLSIDPNSNVGKHFYEGNSQAKDINYMFYKAQSATSKTPIEYKKNNIVIFSLYSPSPNVINFSFGSAYQDKYLNEWVTDYLSDIKFFNIPNFFSMLMDITSGVISVKANKTEYQIKDDYTIITSLKKLFGYCSEDTGNTNDPKTNIPVPDSVFDLDGSEFNRELEKNGDTDLDPFAFTNDELYEIAKESARLYNNQIRFATCGEMMIPINADEVFNGLNDLYSGSQTDQTNSDGTLVYDNESTAPNADDLNKMLDSVLNSGIQKVINNGEEDFAVNIPNIKLELELNLLKQIPYAIMKLMVTPKLLLLFKLGDHILNVSKNNFTTRLTKTAQAGSNNVTVPAEKVVYFSVGNKVMFTNTREIYTIIDISNGVIYFNRPLVSTYSTNIDLVNISISSLSTGKLKDIFKQLGNVIVSKILKNMYNALKAELTKLLLVMLKKVLLQRLSDYAAIIEYLLSLLNSIKGVQFKNCSSTLAQILAMLKLPQLPAIPIPPMLTLTTGALKPGMNEVVAINMMKTKLQKYGINTSQVNTDGSPNAYILGLEAVMSTMINHIKVNSNIQTEVMTAVGPGLGYSQIQ